MNIKKTMMYLLSIAVVWTFGGCAGGPDVMERVFFPYPPDAPKLEFINAYQSDASFPTSAARKMRDALLGEEPANALGRPLDVASDGEGTMYVADTVESNVWVYDLVNYRVKKLTPDPVFVTPVGLALDGDGNLYVSDSKKRKVYVFDKDGNPLFNMSGQAIVDADEAERGIEAAEKILWTPIGVAVDDKLGRVYVTVRGHHRVDVFDKKEGTYLFAIGQAGSADGRLNMPIDVEVAPDGRVVVADTMNARVQVFDSDGKFINKFGRRGSAGDSFGLIKAIGIDTEGHLYVSDDDSKLVKIFDLEGNYLMSLGGGTFSAAVGKHFLIGAFNSVSGIDVDKKNRIYIVDQLNRIVQVFQYLDEEYLKANPLPEVLPPSPHEEDADKGFGEKTGKAAR